MERSSNLGLMTASTPTGVEDELIPSVTQTMDVISKPGLIPWALKEGVEWLSKNLFYDSERDNYHTKSVGIDFLTKG